MAIRVHGLQGFYNIIILLTGHACLNLGRSVHLVPLIHLVTSCFLKFIPVESLLCVLLRIPFKANCSQIVPQIDNILIQGVKGVYYLFGDYLVDRIQPLDLLLKLGESVILMVSRDLASVFLLATHLVLASFGFLVLVTILVVGLVAPILQSLNFLKKPLDGMKVVNQTVLCIVQEVEASFSHIIRHNQKSQVNELVIVGNFVKVLQHLDFSRFSNNTQTDLVPIEVPPGPPLVLSDYLPPFFNHDFNHLL